jgi:uncharacterized Fe-S cluster-containing protein
MTVIKKQEPVFQVRSFDDEEFQRFNSNVFESAIVTREMFEEWENTLDSIELKLDADPTVNLSSFYEKLQLAQEKRNEIITILTKALSYKAMWDSYVSVAEKYVRKLKSELSQLEEVRILKNKELQESKMYSKRSDVFDCLSYCSSISDWVDTMVKVFDMKLNLIDQANLNINRQITVTEMLTYKGLL